MHMSLRIIPVLTGVILAAGIVAHRERPCTGT
jgi:hypothetical protein